MAWELGLDASYYLLATLFQVSLAALVLSTGPRKPVRIGFSMLLGLGGLQSLHLFLGAAGATPFPGPTNRIIDTAILWTIVYLALQFPTSLGGEDGERWARHAWIAVLTLVPGVVLGAAWFFPELYDAARALPHELAFAAGAGALAVHLVPRWLELEAGPLKTQTLYAGAGLAMSAAFFTGLRLTNYFDPGRVLEKLLNGVTGASHVLTIYFILVIVARFVVVYHRDRDPETLAFAGLVGGAVALGAWTAASGLEGSTEFATQVGRPILFALAMLRFDMFRIPERLRRVALPTTAVFLVSLSFLVLAVLFDDGGFGTQSLDPVAALASTTVLAVAIVIGHRWFRGVFLAPVGTSEPAEDRIDRYRLELERARAQANGDEDLERVRRRLGVSRQEHAVLEHLLEEHVVMPTAAVRGAEAGDVIAGRYEVDRELGSGGHGRALLAWDREAERSVVLKEVLHPWEERAGARREALEREIQLARRLDADGLARAFNLVEEGLRTYLVREFVPGRTLTDLVQDEGPLAPDETGALVARIGQAVDRLHEAGLLHLDLKPDNVILTDDGRPVIIDHGTVQPIRETAADGRTATLDGSGPPVGTLAWMAPEQVLEEAVDARTDVFALGALVYFLTTGRHHVEVKDRPRYEIEDEIVRGAPPDDPPPAVRGLVQACLARDPDDRPEDANAVQARLARGSGTWSIEA